MEQFLESPDGQEILRTMAQMTEQGRLEWESPAGSDYIFFATLPRFEVVVVSVEKDDGHPYALELKNTRTGRMVDKYETGVGANSVTLQRIEQLYKAAKRQAMGLGTIARELQEDLDALRREDYGPDEAPF